MSIRRVCPWSATCKQCPTHKLLLINAIKHVLDLYPDYADLMWSYVFSQRTGFSKVKELMITTPVQNIIERTLSIGSLRTDVTGILRQRRQYTKMTEEKFLDLKKKAFIDQTYNWYVKPFLLQWLENRARLKF